MRREQRPLESKTRQRNEPSGAQGPGRNLIRADCAVAVSVRPDRADGRQTYTGNARVDRP